MPKKILLVEYDIEFARDAIEKLKELYKNCKDVQIQAAINPKCALNLLIKNHNENYSLALIGIYYPKAAEYGIDMIKRIRMTRDKKNLAIIAYSAFPIHKESALNAGADDFFDKQDLFFGSDINKIPNYVPQIINPNPQI